AITVSIGRTVAPTGDVLLHAGDQVADREVPARAPPALGPQAGPQERGRERAAIEVADVREPAVPPPPSDGARPDAAAGGRDDEEPAAGREVAPARAQQSEWVVDVLDDVDERHQVELLIGERRMRQHTLMHHESFGARPPGERRARLDPDGVEPEARRLAQQ